MKRIESLRESFSENALKLATVYRSQAVSMELLEKERAQKKKLQGEISKLQDQVNLLTTKNESWSDTLQQLRQQEEKKTSELKEQLQNFQEQVNQLKLQLKNNERVYQSELTKREKNTTSLIADAMQESVEVKRQLDSMAQQFMGIRKTFEKAGICLKSANQALKEKNEQMNAVAEENINLHHQLEMYQDASAKLGFSSLSEEEKDDIIAKLKSQVEELKRKDELVSAINHIRVNTKTNVIVAENLYRKNQRDHGYLHPAGKNNCTRIQRTFGQVGYFTRKNRTC